MITNLEVAHIVVVVVNLAVKHDFKFNVNILYYEISLANPTTIPNGILFLQTLFDEGAQVASKDLIALRVEMDIISADEPSGHHRAIPA